MSIYFVADDFKGPVKIGFGSDVDKRISELQTGNPRPLKFMGVIRTNSEKDDRRIERELHKKYKSLHILREWFSITPDEVLSEIRKYSYTGFLATKKNDVLKILGYDRDGIAEIKDIWEWQSLDWSECCPYCGCICGLQFNEDVMLYECLNCGYHLMDNENLVY